MIRLALLLSLLAAPALAQTQAPSPRPDGLVERSAAAAARAAAEPTPAVNEALVQALAEQPLQVAVDSARLSAMLIEGLEPCWNVGTLSPEAQEVEIVVEFEMTRDAVPIRETIRVVEFSRGTQDAADEALGSAFRAIMRCGQDGLNLPIDVFEQWQRVQVRFDASHTVTR